MTCMRSLQECFLADTSLHVPIAPTTWFAGGREPYAAAARSITELETRMPDPTRGPQMRDTAWTGVIRPEGAFPRPSHTRKICISSGASASGRDGRCPRPF